MLRQIVFVALGLLIIGGFAPETRAHQSDDRLDGLFASLKQTSDPAEGRQITRQIRIIWRQTENVAANEALNKAGAQLYLGRYDDALVALSRALAAQPDLAEAWSRRAAVHYLLGDYPSALADIRQTLALEPRHFGVLAELGAIYMRLEDFAAAETALEKALAINPHLIATRQNLNAVKRRLAGEPA